MYTLYNKLIALKRYVPIDCNQFIVECIYLALNYTFEMYGYVLCITVESNKSIKMCFLAARKVSIYHILH